MESARNTLKNNILPPLQKEAERLADFDFQTAGISLKQQIFAAIASVEMLCSPTAEETFLNGVTTLSKTASSPSFAFTQMGPAGEWPASLDRALISFIRESYQNAQKHARASSVNALLINQPSQVTLTVTDDGKGLSSDAAGGFGLKHLKEWAEKRGGKLIATALDQGGTSLVLSLPIQIEAEEEAEPDPKTHFARILHDDVCQSLTALTLLSGTIRDAIPSDNTDHWQLLRSSNNIFRELTATCRTLAHNL